MDKENKEFNAELVQGWVHDVYGLIILLLFQGQSINLKKLRILHYIFKKPNCSANEIGKSVGLDYKNVNRYIKQLEEGRVIEIKRTSPGKKSPIKIIDLTKEENLDKIEKNFK